MKGETFWIVGIGFSAVQIFFYLEKWWSSLLYICFSIFCWFVWLKMPRELLLLYYIIVTLIYTVLYYSLRPEGTTTLF